jgi:sugar lactone lactonase YvrE
MKKYFLFIFIFKLQLCNAQTISTFAGNGVAGFSGDGGIATNAQLKYVFDIAFDNAGNLFIADGNHRIRKVDTLGTITTIAGNGIAGFSGDGGLAINASFNSIQSLAFDSYGNLYISDFYNHRIRKIDTTGVISTFAGNGMSTANGDSGLATSAALGFPNGMAFDQLGNLYVALGNRACVRKINTAGIITTIAGVSDSSAFNGDGILATTAHLGLPTDVAIDTIGNLFIAEYGNGGRIRKIDASGIIHTVAGLGILGYNGDSIQATAAQLDRPAGLAFDEQWNLYIAEAYGDRIRKIDGSGMITTVAGTGISGYEGDGGPANFAKLNYPVSLTFDTSGNMFIADDFNNCVRKVTPDLTTNDISFSVSALKIFPNPATNIILFDNISSSKNSTYEIFDGIGKQVAKGSVTDKKVQINNLESGSYFIQIKTDQQNSFGRFIKN